MAVETFLAYQKVLSQADNAPGMDGTTHAMKLKTEGYDKSGQIYYVIMTATVKQDESGLFQLVAPPEAEKINLSTRDMALPLEWNSKIAVSPCHEDESGSFIQGRSENYPKFYGAFAQWDDRNDCWRRSSGKSRRSITHLLWRGR